MNTISNYAINGLASYPEVGSINKAGNSSSQLHETEFDQAIKQQKVNVALVENQYHNNKMAAETFDNAIQNGFEYTNKATGLGESYVAIANDYYASQNALVKEQAANDFKGLSFNEIV